MHLDLANIMGLFPDQWILIGIFALLLFGKRLPEVGRSLGKGIIEFKKGLAGVEEDITQAGQNSQASAGSKPALPGGIVTQTATSTYKFDPYTGKPIDPPAAPQARFDPYTGKPITESNSETTTSNA